MSDLDRFFMDQNFLNYQPKNLLSFDHVQGISGAA